MIWSRLQLDCYCTQVKVICLNQNIIWSSSHSLLIPAEQTANWVWSMHHGRGNGCIPHHWHSWCIIRDVAIYLLLQLIELVHDCIIDIVELVWLRLGNWLRLHLLNLFLQHSLEVRLIDGCLVLHGSEGPSPIASRHRAISSKLACLGTQGHIWIRLWSLLVAVLVQRGVDLTNRAAIF